MPTGLSVYLLTIMLHTSLKWKFKGASKVTYLVDTKLGYGGCRV